MPGSVCLTRIERQDLASQHLTFLDRTVLTNSSGKCRLSVSHINIFTEVKNPGRLDHVLLLSNYQNSRVTEFFQFQIILSE